MLPRNWTHLVAPDAESPGADRLVLAQRLCQLCCEATGMTGASLAVSGNGHRSTICATDDRSERLDELQVTFSEGPTVEALREGRAVQVADLREERDDVWTWYTPAALELGARAVFAFPLQVGAIRMGALSTYRTTPGALDGARFRDASALAEAAALLLTLGSEEHTADAFLWAVGDQSRFRAEVHQAVGVTMVQLDVDAQSAFALLCAHAYASGRPVGQVADDVVAKRLRLAKT